MRCEKKSSGREAPAEREARESAKCNERSPPSIVINDTDKNMGAADADKKDVVDECGRQLSEEKTYLKLTEEELKYIISEIQTKLKNTVENHLYKGNCTKKKRNFYCLKCIYTIFHTFILFGKFLKIP